MLQKRNPGGSVEFTDTPSSIGRWRNPIRVTISHCEERTITEKVSFEQNTLTPENKDCCG